MKLRTETEGLYNAEPQKEAWRGRGVAALRGVNQGVVLATEVAEMMSPSASTTEHFVVNASPLV